jgi:hypothetical protein
MIMSKALDMFKGTKQEVPQIKFVLPGSGEEVYMRPFTTKEQKAILKAMEKEDAELIGEAFDALITSCVLNEGFDVNTLYSKDRDAILIKLREESVKDEFKYKWTCEGEKCNNETEETTTLGQLNFIKLSNQGIEKTIDLKNRKGVSLVLGMINRGDEKAMLSYVKKNSQGIKDGISKIELMNGAFASAIKAMVITEVVDGKEQKTVFKDLSFNDKVGIIDDIHMDDKKQVQDFLSGIEKFGFDMDIKVTCKKCGKVQEHSIEWVSFFIM